MQFTPLKNFASPELRSEYSVGLSYTVRPGNTKLAALVEKWLAEGKVRLGTPDAPLDKAKVSGAGKVE